MVQCLLAHNTAQAQKAASDYVPPPESVTLLRQLSSIASIGFAVGSQKLFLNIRHEMKHRRKSPRSLGVALAIFGSVYVAICLLAGPSKFEYCGIIILSSCCERQDNTKRMCLRLTHVSLVWSRCTLQIHRHFCLTPFRVERIVVSQGCCFGFMSQCPFPLTPKPFALRWIAYMLTNGRALIYSIIRSGAGPF